MQYDRVHEYLEAQGHTRESYVEAYCDRVRVVKMGCTYKEWCKNDDVLTTVGTDIGPASSLPAWDMDRPLLRPLCELSDELCEKGNKFCQVVVVFEEKFNDMCDEIQFSAYCQGSNGNLDFSQPHTILVYVPLLINTVSKETTTAEVPFLYTRCHTDRGYREYMSYIYNNGDRKHIWVQAAIFDDTPTMKGDDLYTAFSKGPIGQTVSVKTDTPEFTHTKLRDHYNNLLTWPTHGHTGHLGCVAKINPNTFRRIPQICDIQFSQRFVRILAIGRWWYLITKGRLCNVTRGQTNAHALMFGHPFWSLTLCDRLQRDVHYDVNDLNQRFDAIQNAHTVAIDNLRHDFETASKTVKSDDVNRHIDARAAEVVPYTSILKTQVEVMRMMCGLFKHRRRDCIETEWQRLETMETLLQKSFTQLDTMDTNFQDEVDEKISTAQAEYTDELDARIDAIRAEYTTEITALREALERQQAQHRQAIAQIVRRLDRTLI